MDARGGIGGDVRERAISLHLCVPEINFAARSRRRTSPQPHPYRQHGDRERPADGHVPRRRRAAVLRIALVTGHGKPPSQLLFLSGKIGEKSLQIDARIDANSWKFARIVSLDMSDRGRVVRFWNCNDDSLLALLRETCVEPGADFKIGPEGGVAVYASGTFLDVWVEFTRGLHAFVPAAKLLPTMEVSITEAPVATSYLLLRSRSRRQLQRLSA